MANQAPRRSDCWSAIGIATKRFEHARIRENTMVEWIAIIQALEVFAASPRRLRSQHVDRATVIFTVAATCSVMPLFVEAVPVLANEFADHPYQIIDRSKYPQFSPIGILQRNVDILDKDDYDRELLGHGTAINISPCLILTNYHVPFGNNEYPAELSNFKMTYFYGLSSRGKFATSSTAVPIVKGNLTTRDFSVLRDANCPGLKYGWFDPSDVSSDRLMDLHAHVLVVSYPSDAGFGRIAVSNGSVKGIDPNTGNVMYDASTSPGSSGGAVLIIDENGTLACRAYMSAGAEKEIAQAIRRFPSK